MCAPSLLNIFGSNIGPVRSKNRHNFDLQHFGDSLLALTLLGWFYLEGTDFIALLVVSAGNIGIRTLDGLLTHTPLAGERLQPLGHLSTQTT